MFLVWPLVITPGSYPNWKQMVLSIMVGYVVLLASYMYYSYHVFGAAEKWMYDSLRMVEEKCITQQ
jgi:hypothetical protein